MISSLFSILQDPREQDIPFVLVATTTHHLKISKREWPVTIVPILPALIPWLQTLSVHVPSPKMKQIPVKDL